MTRCPIISVTVLCLVLATQQGCSEGAISDTNSPSARTSVVLGASGSQTCESSDKDFVLLDMIAKQDYACSCDAGDTACFIDDLQCGSLDEGSRAACSPLDADFCKGSVAIDVDSGEACPTKFSFSNELETTCVGAWPRRCRITADCPVGSYCDQLEDGICAVDCTLDSECAPNACDCDGRCDAPPGLDYGRVPIIAVGETYLQVRVDDAGNAIPSRLPVSLMSERLADGESVLARVTVSVGYEASCPADTISDNASAQTIASYFQRCDITWDAASPVNRYIWVRPVQSVTDINDGTMRVSVGDTTQASHTMVAIVAPDEPSPAALASGHYSGLLSLRAAGGAVAAEVTQLEQRVVHLDAPLTADVEVNGSTVKIALQGGPLTGDSIVFVEYSAYDVVGKFATAPLPANVVEASAQLRGPRLDDIQWAPFDEFAIHDFAFDPLAAPEDLARGFMSQPASFLDWSSESGTLRGILPLASSSRDLGMVWSFELALESADPALVLVAPTPLTSPEEPSLRGGWLTAANLAVAPTAFSVSEWQQGFQTQGPSVIPCLNSYLNADPIGVNRSSCEMGPLRGSYADCEETLVTEQGGLLSNARSADSVKKFYSLCASDPPNPLHGLPFDALFEPACDCKDDWAPYDSVAEEPIPMDDVVLNNRSIHLCQTDYALPDIGARDPDTIPDVDAFQYLSAATCVARIDSYDTTLITGTEHLPWAHAVRTTFDTAALDPASGDFYWMLGEAANGDTLEDAWDSNGAGNSLDRSARLAMGFSSSSSDDDAAFSRGEMADACMTDLHRKAPGWAAPIIVADPLVESKSHLAEQRVADLFATDGCISMGKFILSLEWLEEAIAYESTNQLGSGIDTDIGSRLYLRRIQQWLDIHAFMARYGAESDALDRVLAVEGGSTGTTYALEDYMAQVTNGLDLLFDDNVSVSLRSMSGEVIAEPDYRLKLLGDQAALDGLYSELSQTKADHDQHIGLPVAILDTSAAHLDLLTTYLDTKEAAIYSDCVGGVSTGALETAKQWHTGIMQTALWSSAMASSLWASAETYTGNPELVSWEADWIRAQSGFSQSVLLADTAMNRISRCENPLGIEESDLPLYFVDAGTVNRQFFAISDYLLTTWALPAVASADAALDGARQAWLNQRSAEVRSIQTEFDQERRIESFQNRAGAAIRDGCGLSLTAQETWAQYQEGKIDLTSCYVVPPSENPACEERVHRLWERTDHNLLDLAAKDCGYTNEEIASDMRMARRAVCHAMRHYADREASDYPLTGDITSRIIDDTTYGWARDASGAYQLLIIWLGEQTDEFLAASPPESWPFMDSVTVEIDSLCNKSVGFDSNSGYDGIGLDLVVDLHRALHRAQGMRVDLLCAPYLESQPYPPEFVPKEETASEPIDPDAVAECFRGTLGEFELSLLGARQTTRAAQQAILDMRDNYQMHANTCIQLAEIGDKKEEAHQELEAAQNDLGLLADLIGVGYQAGSIIVGEAWVGGGADLVQNAATMYISDRVDDLKQRNAALIRLLDRQAEALTCWSNATATIASLQSHIEGLQRDLIGVATARRVHAHLVTTIGAEAQQTEDDIARAQNRKMPDMRHDYWLDEEVELFHREFAWAKRLTYLAMRAVEYETQGMLGLREQILSAAHPDELSVAVRELQREQATRGINGARPERNQLILSLRDDLMNMVDRTPDPDQPVTLWGERTYHGVQQFGAHLVDPANAVYDDTGEYLGQGIEFQVLPTGPLAYRCAERLWSINAVTVGDLAGLAEPSIPLFVLKQNTFHSQWCAGRGDGSDYQSASNRPSNNLFKGSDSVGSSDEAGAFAWGFVQGWLNVKRRDFYTGGYTNGASAELAGRGLYGRYVLLFPWYGLIDEHGTQLSAIEDILLRFDYLSVSNGPAFGGPGSAPDDPGIPSQTVTGFAAESSTVDTTPTPDEVTIELSWDALEYPGYEVTRVLRTTSATEPTGPDDGSATLIHDAPENTATDTGIEVGTAYSYWAYTQDWDGRWHGPTQADVVALGKISALTCGTAVTGNQLDWALPIDGSNDVVLRRTIGDAAEDATAGDLVALNTPTDALDATTVTGELYTYTVFSRDTVSGTASIDGVSVRCGVLVDEDMEVRPNPTTSVNNWRPGEIYDPDVVGLDGGEVFCFGDTGPATLAWTLWIDTMEQGQASLSYWYQTSGTGTFSLIAYDEDDAVIHTTSLTDTSAGWHLATLDINQSLTGFIRITIEGDTQDFCVDDLFVGVSR